MTAEAEEFDFALVVGAARSGTTLLRQLLDAHPEIGCPAEAGLPSLMGHMVQVWDTIDPDPDDEVVAVDPGQPAGAEGNSTGADTQNAVSELRQKVPEAAKSWVRATMSTAMHRYCDQRDKRLYVDKSLDSAFRLGLVEQLFPGTRCVLAFRHVMDTIASGIEASPWGFQAFGYQPYVQRTPANTVAALANYWLDHVTEALGWEQLHPERCLRVRYEDLVADPAETIVAIQRFLGVQENLDVLRSAFEREPSRGPGDYKLEFTTAVHRKSVGHGKRVPVSMIPPALLAAINEKLVTLGYPVLDQSWNSAERDLGVSTETVWTPRLRALMDAARVPTEHDAGHIGAFALVAEDHRSLRWVIDLESGRIIQGDGEVDAVLTGTTEDLVLMLTDEENLGVLLRSGRIRHVMAEAEAEDARAAYSSLRATAAAARALMPTPDQDQDQDLHSTTTSHPPRDRDLA